MSSSNAVSPKFAQSPEELRALAASALEHATRIGASACECEVSESYGLSVTVRKGEVETVEHNRDKGLGVTVYVGERPKARRGHASSGDFSLDAIRQTVEAALAIARHTAEDDCAGPPDAALLVREMPDLDLFHPWHLATEEAIEIARRSEAAAFAVSKKIRNSEGASLSAQHSQWVLANSLGLMVGQRSTRHSLWCSAIAEDKGLMQRDDWYSAARAPQDVARAEPLGRYAGERAVARLGARKISTRQAPVLFEAPVATQLIGSFVSAVSGGNLYRKASFLLDSLGKQVFAPIVSIDERPLEARGLASSPCDDEGVATRTRAIVRAGKLEGYFLSSYSARKLGMQTTGSAGGHRNLVIEQAGEKGPDFVGMLKQLDRGLLVTETMGMGVNIVTGDYSQGAAGYWVEGGVIRYPVEEITIAGNLKDIFKSIVAIGSDTVVRGARRCGSILVENMMIAGE
jgi:PmbA protein